MALRMLEKFDLRPEDLLAGMPVREVPTFAQVDPLVRERVPAPSRRIYGTYWDRIVAQWGDRRLDEPTATEVRQLFELARETAVVRRSSNGGKAAALHTYYALSCVYRYAVEEQILSPRQNVIARVERPAKGRSRRHALTPALYGEIWRAATSTGNDPALDALLLRLHLETAARLGGVLGLRLRDLDEDQSLVLLREKGSTRRWQPVSPTMMSYLRHHAHDRGAREDDSRVLRFLNGDPLTKKRYETLWNRVGGYVDSVRVQGISTHWLRHTTLTWVERNFGLAVSGAFAGHAEPSSNKHGATHVYVKAGLGEVATALQALTRERHPLAEQPLSTVSSGDIHPLQVPDDGAVSAVRP
jgi:integrase